LARASKNQRPKRPAQIDGPAWGEIQVIRLKGYSLVEVANANGLELSGYIYYFPDHIVAAGSLEEPETLLPWGQQG